MEGKRYIAVVPQDVLGQETSEKEVLEERLLRLPHPRTGKPTLFLPSRTASGDERLLEAQAVQPDPPRSWFIDQEVQSDGSMLLFTPADPLFLVIPLLLTLLKSSRSEGSKPNSASTFAQAEQDPAIRGNFLPMQDLVEEGSRSKSYQLEVPFKASRQTASVASKGKGKARAEVDDEEDEAREMQTRYEQSRMDVDGVGTEQEWMGNPDVLRLCGMDCVQTALKACCETQNIPSYSEDGTSTQDVYYRPSPSAILQHLRSKVAHLSSPSVVDASPSLMRQIAKDGIGEDLMSLTAEDVDGEGPEKEGKRKRKGVADQARTKVACEMLGGYLPPQVAHSLVASYDFSALADHLEQQANLSFAMSHNATLGPPTPSSTASEFSMDVDGGKAKKKAPAVSQGSRGVKALEKVNTSKMKKLDSFFIRKPAVKN